MTLRGLAHPKVRFVGVAAAFAAVYFLVAKLTDSLVGDTGIAVLWPASGVYLGAMLVAPRRLWAALAVGAGLGSLAAYSNAGSSLELSVAFAIPSSAEGLLAAMLIERIVRGRLKLSGLQDVSALAIGAGIATAFVAISAGAVAAQTFNASFAESWLRWWSADLVGVLAVTPLVVTLARSPKESMPGAEVRYSAGVFAAIVLSVWFEPSGAIAMLGGALALPILLWAGWRWGPRAAALGGAGLALSAMHLASASDLLGTGDIQSAVHVLQAFLGALLFSALAFAAAVADWRAERVTADRSTRRLRAVTDSSPDAYVTVNSEGVITGWSASAETMFGLAPDQTLGRPLESVAPGAGPVTPTPEARDLTLLARHRSGREFPAALKVRPGVDGEDGLLHVFIRDLTESERLGKELGRATKELERRGQAHEEARTELRGTSRELDRANRRIDELTAALANADADLDRTKSDLRRRDTELATAQRDLENRAREHAASAIARDRAETAAAASARETERLRAVLARAKTDAAEIAREADRLRADLARAENGAAEADGLREELSRAEDAAAEFGREADGLREELSRAEDAAAEFGRDAEGLRAELGRARDGAEEFAREAERLRAELADGSAALAAADAERRVVGKHSLELISRYDERGVCLYASPGAFGLLGYEPGELVGRPGAELIHPEDRGRLLRARAAQSESTFEARLRHRNGEYVRVEVGFRPAAAGDGRLGEVTTIVRPLAEPAAGADRPRVSETRFNSLFGTLPAPAALVSQDGRIRRANLAFSRLTGYSRDQLEGTALGTLVDDQEATVFAGRLRQVATGQVATLRLEQQLVHSAGRAIPVELSVTPLPGDTPDAGHELVIHFEQLTERAGAFRAA